CKTGPENSESRRLGSKTTLELSASNTGKKDFKLTSQVPAADFVFESFGNARVLFNPSASRFGKYTKLQFSDRGCPTGAKLSSSSLGCLVLDPAAVAPHPMLDLHRSHEAAGCSAGVEGEARFQHQSLALAPSSPWRAVDLPDSACSQAVPVIEPKKVLACGGKSIGGVFPMQISAVCGGINGNLSPFVSFNPKNNLDPNALYHDFRSYTNDSRPNWYYEQMITMRYLARVGFVDNSQRDQECGSFLPVRQRLQRSHLRRYRLHHDFR
ncbi:hypothetical protein AAF712_015754, partial [Marasmius tenuissimus]